MADGVQVQVVGAGRFAATCSAAARDMTTMGRAPQVAGNQLAGQARSRAPRLTGRLASSIRSVPDGQGGFTVQVQLSGIYPLVQEFGSRRGVRARRYMRGARDAGQQEVVNSYEHELERIVGTIRGA